MNITDREMNGCFLSAGHILEYFPCESSEYLKSSMRGLLDELKPYFDFADKVKEPCVYNVDIQNFWLAALRIIKMPKQKMDYLKRLRTMEQLMRHDKFAIKDEDIQRAKEVPIESLYSGWKKLKKTRNGFTACCVFHDDSTPSFEVKKNMFLCYGCQVRGDAIEFIRKLENLNFMDAIKRINGI